MIPVARDNDPYVMLITSLPRPDALFLAKQPPLSRLRLDQRLRVLSPEDAQVLRLVEQALDWRRLPMGANDREALRRGRQALARIDRPTLRAIVRERLEIRTCVAGLRARLHGEGPPTPGAVWGFGRWMGQMTRNWSDPAFGLDGVFPWLREADRLLRAGDSLGLERLLLEQAFTRLQRHTHLHTFDLEAVVIYVLKWSIVERWARYNGEAARRRFDDLTEAGLGNFAALNFGAAAEAAPREAAR